ncbi:hypothetical protein [Leptospira idonii]|uniref:Uncharacterized protein n=1 Tax=Leptospira idonii TaxID=1193500 RepID=A0A4R9LW77_9LEPT|nr:hypothetical protein [Leptospira idonii]TGN17069.1 hypothetical protein EHS15_17965 [Leptospira idonii]
MKSIYCYFLLIFLFTLLSNCFIFKKNEENKDATNLLLLTALRIANEIPCTNVEELKSIETTPTVNLCFKATINGYSYVIVRFPEAGDYSLNAYYVNGTAKSLVAYARSCDNPLTCASEAEKAALNSVIIKSLIKQETSATQSLEFQHRIATANTYLLVQYITSDTNSIYTCVSNCLYYDGKKEAPSLSVKIKKLVP